MENDKGSMFSKVNLYCWNDRKRGIVSIDREGYE